MSVKAGRWVTVKVPRADLITVIGMMKAGRGIIKAVMWLREMHPMMDLKDACMVAHGEQQSYFAWRPSRRPRKVRS